MNKLGKIFLCFIAGIIYSFNFPNKDMVSWVFMPVISMAIFFWCLSPNQNESKTPYTLKFKLLLALSFSVGAALLGYYWIPYTISEFGGVPAPFNYIIGSLLSPFALPQFYSFVLFAHFLERIRILKELRIYSRVTLYAFLLTLCEIITPQQFPSKAGHGFLVLAPYIGLAPILGSGVFSFFLYYLASAINGAIKKYPFNYPIFLFALFFIVANTSYPLKYKTTEDTLKTRIVQANIGSLMKVQSEGGDGTAIDYVFKTYSELSTQKLLSGNNKLDLIIWPETALPGVLSTRFMKQENMPFPLIISSIVRQWNAEMIFGGYDANDNPESEDAYFETQYNTIYHAGDFGRLENFYHKQKLIPFGETMPFGPLNKYLNKLNTNVSFFAAGDDFPLFKLRNNFIMMPIVCYEILFPDFVRNYLNKNKNSSRPHFIINVTNDSWYGDTSEPHQHLFLSHWRALEFGIPIIRSTNTGITSILYPDGTESERILVDEKKVLDIDLKKTISEVTVYQKYGDIPLILLMLTLVLLSYGINRFLKKDGNIGDEVHFTEN